MATSSTSGDTPAGQTSRRRFLRLGAGAGVGALVAGYFLGVGDWIVNKFDRKPQDELSSGAGAGSVIVVGAGPAGMTAAHLLKQRGADVRVLEANSTYGGRTAHNRDFADFPIPLGAEWIHVDPDVLNTIVADDEVTVETGTIGYKTSDTFGTWDDDFDLTIDTPPVDPDLKFVGSSWLDFFETYILPGIARLITYNTPIERIEYGDDGVTLTDQSGAIHQADRVVVTVPLKILQLDMVTFDPPLPDSHISAIEDATVWSGFKAFIEFDEPFYPTFAAGPDASTPAGQQLYYDAAYGQDTDANILGLFAVGDHAERYQAVGDDVIDLMLSELDAAFDGAASRSYVKHLVQNWNEQPWARGAYLNDDADYRLSRRLSQPVADRVFFAGDAYTKFDDWSSVHTATRSASDAVRAILSI